MGLESLLDRLERETVTAVTAVTAKGVGAVTQKPLSLQACTAVTLVTAEKINAAPNERALPAVWSCRVDGVTFTAIDPSRKPDEEMIQRFRLQFGRRFEQAKRIR